MSHRTAPDAPPLRLVEGLRIDQPTFHALYEATPAGVRAELINGVVHIPSPVGGSHGRAHAPVIGWLLAYVENTPGVEVLDNATMILGSRSEPQPDAMLRVFAECGGRSRDEEGYIHDAPELVVEVSKTTRFVDLGPKLDDYERAGVLEYIVRAVEPDGIQWFVARNRRFVELEPDSDDVYRSNAFPGLWLDPTALLAADIKGVRAVVEQGCATAEHEMFVASLAAARRKK